MGGGVIDRRGVVEPGPSTEMLLLPALLKRPPSADVLRPLATWGSCRCGSRDGDASKLRRLPGWCDGMLPVAVQLCCTLRINDETGIASGKQRQEQEMRVSVVYNYGKPQAIGSRTLHLPEA